MSRFPRKSSSHSRNPCNRCPSYETVDVAEYLFDSKHASVDRPQKLLPNNLPNVLLTTISSKEPVEFSTLSSFHNFNLQLSGTPLVQLGSCKASKKLIVPGQVSLNIAGEPFRAVVWPTDGLLTLHVRIQPSTIARIREELRIGTSASSGELSPWFGEWNDKVRELACRIAEAATRFGTSDRLMMDQLQHALAFEIVRRNDGPRLRSRPGGRMDSRKLRNVVEYICDELGSAVSLDELATIAGLSPFHFCRAFKLSVGVTPHRYLTEMRLDRARLLLATTNRSVTSIAMSLGFDSPSHFCNVFRANTAMTPTSFRQKNT